MQQQSPVNPLQLMLQPRYWTLLQNPEIKTVFLTGCGGGFDFIHSMTIIPALLAMGKKVVVGSYSFGDPTAIRGGVDVWRASEHDPERFETYTIVRLVDGDCIPDRNYGPEVGLCQYLDQNFPMTPTKSPQGPKTGMESEGSPTTQTRGVGPNWRVYAYNARAFTVRQLRAFLTRVCNTHDVDAIIAMDGGSDSLMRGDEGGLGDPIEDAVTVAAIATLRDPTPASPAKGKAVTSPGTTFDALPTIDPGRRFGSEPIPPTVEAVEEKFFDVLRLRKPLLAKMLICIGVGCDRFNGVSDAATFRAIAELSAIDEPVSLPESDIESELSTSPAKDKRPMPATERGFLGSMALTPDSPLAQHYGQLIDHLQKKAFFRSVIANCIVETSNGSGAFGSDTVPVSLRRRVGPGELYIWPFMSYHFSFWIPCVYRRALLGPRLSLCKTVSELYAELHKLREKLKADGSLREHEPMPPQPTGGTWKY